MIIMGLSDFSKRNGINHDHILPQLFGCDEPLFDLAKTNRVRDPLIHGDIFHYDTFAFPSKPFLFDTSTFTWLRFRTPKTASKTEMYNCSAITKDLNT
jgi:hypothetical protein